MKSKRIHFYFVSLLTLFFTLSSWSSIVYSKPNEVNDFKVIKQQTLGQLGIFRQIQISGDKYIDVYAVTLSDHYHANLFIQDARSQENAKFIDDLSSIQTFRIAINGSYYLPNFKPLGLVVNKGKIEQPIRNSKLLNGCIAINQNGKLSLTKMDKICTKSYYALQAGPIIINNSQINPTLLAKRNKIGSFWGSSSRRTLLAQSTDGQIIILATSAISFYELSNLLLHHVNLFGVKAIAIAINLDGGSSTSLYIRFPDSNPMLYYPEIKPVKTFIFFNY